MAGAMWAQMGDKIAGKVGGVVQGIQTQGAERYNEAVLMRQAKWARTVARQEASRIELRNAFLAARILNNAMASGTGGAGNSGAAVADFQVSQGASDAGSVLMQGAWTSELYKSQAAVRRRIGEQALWGGIISAVGLMNEAGAKPPDSGSQPLSFGMTSEQAFGTSTTSVGGYETSISNTPSPMVR